MEAQEEMKKTKREKKKKRGREDRKMYKQMRGKVSAPVLRSKGTEMVIDRITPHEYKFAAVLSPAAFLQGWTLALAGSPWMGRAGVLHCSAVRLGAQSWQGGCQGEGLCSRDFLGESGIPSQHRKATCACIQAFVSPANLSRIA